VIFGSAYADPDTVERIGEAARLLHRYSHQSPLSHANMMIENNLPWLGRHTRAARAKRFLDGLIYAQIAERRAAGRLDGPDLLSELMRAQAQHPELRFFTDRHIRDEVFTMFLAGHETTASALTWTWYLLSRHPDAERRFHDELDRALGGRAPTNDDVPGLAYTRKVLMESMRLYPPVWTLGRRPAVEAIQVGPWTIPNKSMILVSPYLTHHDPRLFPDPERFDPERFAPEQEAARHRYAYFPFAGGNRKCIGEALAWMEGMLSLASIGSRWRLRLAPGQRVAMDAFISLKPKYGMRMTLERRAAAPPAGAPVARESAPPRASR
jgi:cytochrome P450